MPRPRKVDLLPEDLRQELDDRLRSQGFSGYMALSEWLGQQGYSISHAALHDYGRQLKQYGEKMRQAREVAQVWIGSLGSEPQGKVGQLVNEILRTLAFDLSLAIGEQSIDAEDIPATARTLKDLAIMMEKLEKAASDNLKREAEIREQTRREAAQAVETAARGKGLSEETIRTIREQVMGIS